MAVKKGILDNFLKPNSHYHNNKKDLRAIFIDKNEDDLRLDPQNFLEASVVTTEASVSTTTSCIQSKSKKHDTNQTQTKHKVDTNLTQKPNTNSIQTQHIECINNTYQTQSKHKPNTKLNTRKTQSKHKVDTNLTQTVRISTLIGVQRKILLFIFEECKKVCSRITEPLTIIHIATGLEIATGSVKTSIARLCEKEFLIINSFKNGRGGWSVYEISDNVYKELLQMETQHKLNTNLTQSRHKVDTKLNTQPNTTASSSSSLNIETTTTSEIHNAEDTWKFDITPYAKFGFKAPHIKQLASLGVVSATEVEQSLIEFSYDMQNSSLPPIKTNKINFLMGLLRSGHSYVSEGFKNEHEAMIEEMARRSEAKRKKRLEAKFETWIENLTDDQKRDIENKLPTHLMVLQRAYGFDNPEIRNWCFEYFMDKGTE